jgi:hypothetical protein
MIMFLVDLVEGKDAPTAILVEFKKKERTTWNVLTILLHGTVCGVGFRFLCPQSID